MPLFNEADPVQWFQVLELQFQLNQITGDAAKLGILLPLLGNAYTQWRGFTNSGSQYEDLKNTLIENNKVDPIDAATRALLNIGQTYAERPSQLLIEMLAQQDEDYASSSVNAYLAAAWKLRLPRRIQNKLDLTGLSYQQMGKKADNIFNAPVLPSQGVHAVLEQEESDEDVHVSAVLPSGSKKGWSRSQPPVMPPSQAGWTCKFHIQYGIFARSCQPGCSWAHLRGTKGYPQQGDNSSRRNKSGKGQTSRN